MNVRYLKLGFITIIKDIQMVQAEKKKLEIQEYNAFMLILMRQSASQERRHSNTKYISELIFEGKLRVCTTQC